MKSLCNLQQSRRTPPPSLAPEARSSTTSLPYLPAELWANVSDFFDGPSLTAFRCSSQEMWTVTQTPSLPVYQELLRQALRRCPTGTHVLQLLQDPRVGAYLGFVRALNLAGKTFQDGEFDALCELLQRSCANLRSIDLASNNLRPRHMLSLARVTQLEDVTLSNNYLRQGGLANLAPLSHLHTLRVNRCDLKDPCGALLGAMTGLRCLDVSTNWLTSAALVEIGKNHVLEVLVGANNAFDTRDKAPLQSCKALRLLDLSDNSPRKMPLSCVGRSPIARHVTVLPLTRKTS